MSRIYPMVLLATLLFWGLPLVSAQQPDPPSAPPHLRGVRVADAISPVIAQFIVAELEQAREDGAQAFLLELDTPGGLDTAMRSIIQAMLASPLPVIVYVYPSGARAASAGALITLAADFAAMAPGTNIGAAHPVAIGPVGGDAGQEGTMMAKVLNDAVAYARSLAQQRGRNVEWAESMVRESLSTPANEALALQVIDLVAVSEEDLLNQLHGRRYLRDGQDQLLHTAGATLVFAEMSWRQEILKTLSNPNVAYLLLMLGILGIFFEISQPGAILPGAIGAMALLLAFFAFQTLPVNYAGVLLILLSVVLFILEIKVTSYGMLTVGGILSMALGSLMLIESSEPYLQISRVVIAATVGVTAGFFALVLFFVVRTQKTPFVSGAEGMVGEGGRAVSDIHTSGKIYVHGEYWEAFSQEPIAAGATVEVVQITREMRVEVKLKDEG